MATRFVNIEEGEELRLQIDEGNDIRIMLMKAHPKGGMALAVAEVNGAEIYPEIERYISAGSNTSIYSWTGCTVHITGKTIKEHRSRAPFMVQYLNISSALEQRRVAALAEQRIGPRILVVGGSCVGKSTLCHILTNYAIRGGWAPALINLDPRGTSDRPFHVNPPGTIGASMLTSVDETKESSICINIPCGLSNWQTEPSVYLSQVVTLSAIVAARLRVAAAADRVRADNLNKQRLNAIAAGVLQEEASQKKEIPPGEGGIVASSGCIIDAMSDCTPEVAVEIIKAFGCESVIVVGHDPLRQAIQQLLQVSSATNVAVIPLNRSDGAIPYDQNRRLLYNLETLTATPIPVRRTPVGMAAGLLPPPPLPNIEKSFVIEKELHSVETVMSCAMEGVPFPSNGIILLELVIVETVDPFDPSAPPTHAMGVRDFTGDIRSLVDMHLLVSHATDPAEVPKSGIAGVAVVVGMEAPGMETYTEDGHMEVTTTAKLTLRTSLACFNQQTQQQQPMILIPVIDIPPVFKTADVIDAYRRKMAERAAEETRHQPSHPGGGGMMGSGGRGYGGPPQSGRDFGGRGYQR